MFLNKPARLFSSEEPHSSEGKAPILCADCVIQASTDVSVCDCHFQIFQCSGDMLLLLEIMWDFKCAHITTQQILVEQILLNSKRTYRLQAQCFIRLKGREKQAAGRLVTLKLNTLKLLVHSR